MVNLMDLSKLLWCHLKKNNMRRIYFTSLLIIIASIAVMLWFFFYLINAEKSKIRNELTIEATKVERILVDNFNHTVSILNSINAQIKEDPYNKKHINEVLKRFKTSADLTGAFSWTIFSWADSSHQIIVDSTYGIMKDPFDLSIRDYVHYAKAEPGKFVLGNTVIGSTSRKWMIPSGIGLLDKNGNFAGTITIGFEINVLAKIIQDLMQSKTVKIIIFDTKNNSPIVAVNANAIEVFNNDFVGKIDNINKINLLLKKLKISNKEEISDIDIIFEQEGYLVEKIENYPLAIVLEYNKSAILEELWLVIYSRLCEIIFIISIAAILMWMINKIKIEQMKQYMSRRKIEKINRITSEIFFTLSNHVRNQVLQINNTVAHLKSSFKDSDLDMKQELYLKEIREISKNSLDILDDLSDVNWAGNKNFAVDMQNKIDINHIIKRIININLPIAHKKKISIEFNSEKIDPMIKLDPKGMKQIFMNLISNSIKHSLSNSVIKINGKKVQNKLVISIKDSGYGIKQDVVKKIFDEKNNYHNFESSTDFGVGLSLVKKLVELQKGKMEIISMPNKGTEIILSFSY